MENIPPFFVVVCSPFLYCCHWLQFDSHCSVKMKFASMQIDNCFRIGFYQKKTGEWKRTKIMKIFPFLSPFMLLHQLNLLSIKLISEQFVFCYENKVNLLNSANISNRTCFDMLCLWWEITASLHLKNFLNLKINFNCEKENRLLFGFFFHGFQSYQCNLDH